MTQTELRQENKFVSVILPWLLATAMLIVYVATLNHWISFLNFAQIARVTGQTGALGTSWPPATWNADYYSPLFNFITIPFRWLSPSSVPLAGNIFSAVCAGLIVWLLTRSVALLPHDRTQAQREREQSPHATLSLSIAWVPPLLAVVVCGLQLSFWERATNLSGEMFDLLLFAYVVRSFLEYRVSHKESWLLRATLVYAASMADSWVLLGLLPIFLTAVVWSKGFNFFNLQFLSRLFLCGLAGLLFYLYLPAIHLFSGGNFWEALQANVGFEFNTLKAFWQRIPHSFYLLFVLTSLLPILIMAIRWKSSFGESSRVAVIITTWIFHVAHAALLLVCIWQAFDPVFGLRHNGLPLLPLYYLGALSVGYFSGYFLLVFKSSQHRSQRITPAQNLLNAVSTGTVCALLIIVPPGLLYKNIPQIRVTNGPAIKQYASLLKEKLPSSGVIVSDFAFPLFLAKSVLAPNGLATNYFFLNSHALEVPAYHRLQLKNHPGEWPVFRDLSRDDYPFRSPGILRLLSMLSTNHPIYYLQSSFGYFFEIFYMQPHGLVYELKPYATNTVVFPPSLTEAQFVENETFWEQVQKTTDVQLTEVINSPASQDRPSFRQRFAEKLKIPFEANATAAELGTYFSRALNNWGVQAQQMGRLEAAREHFTNAEKLSPNNVVATSNLEFNKKLHAGQHVPVENPTSFEERFGKFSDLEQLMNVNGIFDDPTGCIAEGIAFARGGLNRQAAQYLERGLTLAPESLLARSWLARIYLFSQTPAKAEPLIDHLNAHADGFDDAGIDPLEVFRLDLASAYVNKEPQKADRLLQNAFTQQSHNTNLLQTIVQVSISFHQYSNALAAVNKNLELHPNQVMALVNKGFINLQLGNFEQAIAPLTQAISLQSTNFQALLNRAIAYLSSEKLDDAERDYETLLKLDPKAYPVYYGLGEIAFRKKDTNAAIRYYEQYMANAVTNSDEAKFVAERLKSLKTSPP